MFRDIPALIGLLNALALVVSRAPESRRATGVASISQPEGQAAAGGCGGRGDLVAELFLLPGRHLPMSSPAPRVPAERPSATSVPQFMPSVEVGSTE